MKFLLKALGFFFIGKHTVTVTIDMSDEDWAIFSSVRKALKKLERYSKATLELEIVGISRVHPTVILSLHDLLSRRSSSVKLRVNVLTNLADGALIFPLLADELHFRRQVWFQYAGVEELEKKAPHEDEEEGEGWKSESSKSRVNTVKEPSAITDYRTMTAMLGEYLPLAEFKGKRLPLEETLREHSLLPDPVRDEFLARHFRA